MEYCILIKPSMIKNSLMHLFNVSLRGCMCIFYFLKDFSSVFFPDYVKHLEFFLCPWKMLCCHDAWTNKQCKHRPWRNPNIYCISDFIYHSGESFEKSRFNDTSNLSHLKKIHKIHKKEFRNRGFFCLCLFRFSSLMFTQAERCVMCMQMKYEIQLGTRRGGRTDPQPASVFHTPSQMWLCSHVSEPDLASAVKVLLLTFMERSRSPSDCTGSPSGINEESCCNVLLPDPQQRATAMYMNSGGGGAETWRALSIVVLM